MHVDTRGGFGLAVMGLLRSNLAPMLAARSGGRTSAPPANGRDIVCQYRRADLRCGMANPPTKYARMMARSLLPHHEMGMFRISSTRAPSLHPHAKRLHDLRDVMGLCGGFGVFESVTKSSCQIIALISGVAFNQLKATV